MSPLDLTLLAVAGLLAGVVNTLAGGGSLLALPALIFLGLPADVANATNRVGVVIQSSISSHHFWKAGALSPREAGWLLLPTCAGALVGARLAVGVDEGAFRKVIAVAMLGMLVVTLAKPERFIAGAAAAPRSTAAVWVSFFGIGLYGGFLQAGVGIFLLGGLVMLAGRDAVRANAVKALLVAALTLPALLYYAHSGLVRWVPGLALALGSGVGGWLGAKMTVRWGPPLVRDVLVAVIVASSTKLLGLW